MFAGYFIADGLAAVRDPEARAPQAEAFTNKAVPLVQRVVPASYSSSVPEQAVTWVRLAGGAKVFGGLMFATGIGRRLGAGLLAISSVLDVAVACPSQDTPAQDKRAARANALKHVALLGAAILAARDTQGRPSLAWRADQRAQLAQKRASELGEAASKRASKLSKKTKKQAQKANKKLSKMAKEVTR